MTREMVALVLGVADVHSELPDRFKREFYRIATNVYIDKSSVQSWRGELRHNIKLWSRYMGCRVCRRWAMFGSLGVGFCFAVHQGYCKCCAVLCCTESPNSTSSCTSSEHVGHRVIHNQRPCQEQHFGCFRVFWVTAPTRARSCMGSSEAPLWGQGLGQPPPSPQMCWCHDPPPMEKQKAGPIFVSGERVIDANNCQESSTI